MKSRLICITLLLCVLLSACGGEPEAGAPLFAERGAAEREPLGELKPAADPETLLAALSAAGESHAADWDPGEPEQSAGLRLEDLSPEAGDTAATDGGYIYMLDSYGLILLSAAGTRSEMLSYTRVAQAGAGWSRRLFLGQDRVAVVCTVSGEDGEELWEDGSQVRVILLDTADKRAPRLLGETAVEGSLVDARLVGDSLCLVTQRSFLSLPESGEALLPRLREQDETLSLEPGDVYLCPNPTRAALTVAAALRMEDGRISDALAFTDGTEAVCGEGNQLILSRTRWDETASQPYREEPYRVVDYSVTARTELKSLRLENGSLRLEGGCVLEGALPDASAMKLENGVLYTAAETDSRVFSAYTDENHGWTNYEGKGRERGARLTLLDGGLNALGALTELGGQTGLRACRFAGGMAWFSAAGEADRLYGGDLRDPAAPAMSDSLSLPADSLWMRSLGEGSVLGLAAPAGEEDWQLLVLDTGDPAHPRQADSLKLGKLVPAFDPADRGAVFTDPETGLIGLPVREADSVRYLLVRWTGDSLKKLGTISPEYIPGSARAMLLNGLLYLCGPGEVYVTDPDSLEILASVSNAVG